MLAEQSTKLHKPRRKIRLKVEYPLSPAVIVTGGTFIAVLNFCDVVC